MKIKVYAADGSVKSERALEALVFESKINEELMHQSIVRRLANARNPIAHIKSRGEISATTKKAFRQKGTGNARRGAKSTNLLRGGGVTHGPRNTRNFSKDMPRQQRRAALRSSLSVKAKGDAIFGLADWKTDAPKTKSAAEFLGKAPEAKRYLLVVGADSKVLQKSFSNLSQVRIVRDDYLHPYDVLWADQICFTLPALDTVEKNFTPKSKAVK